MSRLRSAVFDKAGDVNDVDQCRVLSSKNLKYLLKVALYGGIYYQRSRYTDTDIAMMRSARITLSRLSRQIDFFGILPPDQVGAIGAWYPVSLFPYFPTGTTENARWTQEISTIRDILRDFTHSYAVFLST